jgi:hypothetical protein
LLGGGGHGGGLGNIFGGLMGGSGAGHAGLGGILGGSTGLGMTGMGGGSGGLFGRGALGAVERGGLDRMLGGEVAHRVDGQARLHVNVSDQRVGIHAPRPSGLFRDATVHRQAQMIPAQHGPPATPMMIPGGMGGGGTFG